MQTVTPELLRTYVNEIMSSLHRRAAYLKCKKEPLPPPPDSTAQQVVKERSEQSECTFVRTDEMCRLKHIRSQGGMPPKLLAYLVILCFEMWYPKQNTVARLK